VECDLDVELDTNASFAFIANPNFPHPFPANSRCTYNIKTAAKSVLSLFPIFLISFFHLSSSNS
jgi:hypothetical protein